MIATVWSLAVAHPFPAALIYLAVGVLFYLLCLRIEDEFAQPPGNMPRQIVGGYTIDMVLVVFWAALLGLLAVAKAFDVIRGGLSLIASLCQAVIYAPRLVENRRALRHASRLRRRPPA